VIQLRVRTEYSFRRAYGRLDQVLAQAGGNAMAMTDVGTWGHANFAKAAKKKGIKPIFGAEIAVTPLLVRSGRSKSNAAMFTLLARNNDGLRELYQLVSLANDQFHYYPQMTYEQLNKVSEDLWILIGEHARTDLLDGRHRKIAAILSPRVSAWNRRAVELPYPSVVVSDNLYPTPQDQTAYEVLAWQQRESRTTIGHIAGEHELRSLIPEADDAAFYATHHIADDCNATLPRAEIVKPEKPKSLYEMCMDGAEQRGVDVRWDLERVRLLVNDTYRERLARELQMIADKNFEDYFYVIADLVNWAKTQMLVGPARGSSAGSLVCYLLGITDVDPIVHDLMFERFIDITRADLPDIDIDFQDTKRDLLFTYLEERYGKDRVGRLGTVSRYKAKSALGDVAKELSIPEWEIKDVKGAVVERSTGDARAQFCIKDTLEGLDIGKALLAKYPGLALAGELEGHATNTGKHAAGVVLSAEPIRNYCSQSEHGVACIDKKDAETLNMLKIDALGLRTLSILQDALDQLGKDREWLINYPLDDQEAFEVLNAEKYSGIFQFEGFALQSLCRQMKVKEFNDIVAITSLARPGPLHGGATTEFIERRTGRVKITYLHPLAEPITRETFGTVVYQEQVMMMCRELGRLTWEDVSELRKAMSKSLGEEFFNTYWERFKIGAKDNGIDAIEARRIWERMCTFGSWAFNKSHAVSYGLISYWCAVLKAHYPLQFAAACLRNPKDDEQPVKLLRELVLEGFEFVPVDPLKSGISWSVVDGKLLGGLTNIKGMGTSKAADVLRRREAGLGYQPGQVKLLAFPRTPFDDIFEAQRRFGDWYKNPKAHNVLSGPITHITDVSEPGEYVFIGRLMEKNLRDLNEYGNVVKRGGRLVQGNSLFLNIVIEDDTGSIICKVERNNYQLLGKPLVEEARIGDWFIWKGIIKRDGWRMVMIRRWQKLPVDDGDTGAKDHPELFNALEEKYKPKGKKQPLLFPDTAVDSSV
jgi:DNA polymerase III alpha subunit